MKFSLNHLEDTIYPQNNCKPILNNYGKYGIKFHLNGTYRLVEVDDYILTDGAKAS